MKFFACIFILTLFFAPGSRSQDMLHWQAGNKLKWSDFRGSIDTTKTHGAVSTTGIHFKASYTNGELKYDVHSFFNRKTSWVRIHSQAGLEHEQGHFDIAEIYARKLRVALKSFKANPSSVQKDLQDLYIKVSSEKESRNQIYDKETNFSINNQRQEEWNRKIQQELATLADFGP